MVLATEFVRFAMDPSLYLSDIRYAANVNHLAANESETLEVGLMGYGSGKARGRPPVHKPPLTDQERLENRLSRKNSTIAKFQLEKDKEIREPTDQYQQDKRQLRANSNP